MREVLQTELQQEQREKSSPNSKIPHTKRKTLLDMTLCAVCAALTCVLAPLSLPSYNPEVPISLATFAVMIAGGLLKPKYAALSQVIYILLGFAGLPVFAGFTAGVGILARPSAGYMFGYIVLAWLESLIFHGFGGERRMALGQTVLLVLGMISGTMGCYILGTVWFMVMMQTPLWTALVSCVIPFLFGDAVKIAVAAVIVPQIRRAFDSVMGKRKLA
jgi:biotin transport system substrate-specific component